MCGHAWEIPNVLPAIPFQSMTVTSFRSTQCGPSPCQDTQAILATPGRLTGIPTAQVQLLPVALLAIRLSGWVSIQRTWQSNACCEKAESYCALCRQMWMKASLLAWQNDKETKRRWMFQIFRCVARPSLRQLSGVPRTGCPNSILWWKATWIAWGDWLPQTFESKRLEIPYISNWQRVATTSRLLVNWQH